MYYFFYSNIIKDSNFKYIDKIKLSNINKYVKSNEFLRENFELKETELKQLLSQINALILKINKDVFNFTEWTPEKV